MPHLTYSEAKSISIVDYLSRMGFEPDPRMIKGNDYWYISPIRPPEKTPSFHVNSKKNTWYDFGGEKPQGGNFLDLGAKLHKCTVHEFVQKLAEGNLITPSILRQPAIVTKPESKIEIVSVSNSFGPALREYLNERGIAKNIAEQFCKEVEYRIGHHFYTAIGFPNRSGAYELRNKWFQGSSAPKDVSFIQNNSNNVSVFEGFMDFLSVQQLNLFKDQTAFKQLSLDSNFLVLNSIGLLNKNVNIIADHKEVNLFLDNDQAASNAKESLRQQGIRFHDASNLFSSHKDVNEYLQAARKLEQVEKPRQRKSRGMRP